MSWHEQLANKRMRQQVTLTRCGTQSYGDSQRRVQDDQVVKSCSLPTERKRRRCMAGISTVAVTQRC